MGVASEAGALASAIRTGLSGAGIPALTAGTQRLMAAYRSGETPAAPLLATRDDAAAYAAYRMPATAAAAALALQETRLSLPDWTPATLLDIGAGTGSMAWAAAATLPSLTAITLLEQSAEAIRLGSSILGSAALPVLRSATWRRWQLPGEGASRQPDRLPTVDLATACYVLGELTQGQQAALVTLASAAAPAVVLVEPGTPAGHRRILAAREQLLAAGYGLAAPCPHELGCPLAVAGTGVTSGRGCRAPARTGRSRAPTSAMRTRSSALLLRSGPTRLGAVSWCRTGPPHGSCGGRSSAKASSRSSCASRTARPGPS